MVATYGVYLSKSKVEPETGTEGTDWIKFTAQIAGHIIKFNNPKKKLIGYKSFRIPIGKREQSVTLTNCVFLHADGGSGSNYYDNFIQLICDANKSPGFDLYLWVLNPFLEGQHMKWNDKDSAKKDYIQVTVDGINFKLDATQLTMVGTIAMSEVWD